jgi:hypothetical protein
VLWRRPYCAVICEHCRTVVGYESPPTEKGKAHLFQGTEKQVKRRWYEMNKEAIDARRKREKAWKGRRWGRIDFGNPDLYEMDEDGEE